MRILAIVVLLMPGWVFAQEKVPTSNDLIRQALDEASLDLRFQGQTAAECRDWQKKFGDKLRACLGPHAPPAEWKTVSLGAQDLPGFRREHYLLTAAGHPPLPIYLLLPRPMAKDGRAGIVALHGHGSHGHHPIAGRDDLPGVDKAIAGANYDYGRQLALKGYVVAVPCMQPFGDRLGAKGLKEDPCGITFLRLQALGKVLMAENLRDCRWAVELLARHPEVDADRLGCVGLSYGGRMTMLTTALEPRIKVAVVSGALNVMQERLRGAYSCGAQIIPGLLPHGDVPEIAGLIAPRPCLWEAGLQDKLIVPDWADKALERIRRPYQALGAEKSLRVDRHDDGHVWHGAVAYPFLEEALGRKSH